MDYAREYRILGPDGSVVGHELTSEDLDKALSGVSWKYNVEDYDPKLKAMVGSAQLEPVPARGKIAASLREERARHIAGKIRE